MTLKSLFTASALIAIGMLAGRLLGLLREMLLAAQFGISDIADQAVLLLIVPDFITSAFIGSAASAALLPAFAARTPHEACKLFHECTFISVAAFSMLALLLYLVTGWNIPSAAWALTLLALPLSAATAIFTAYLQYRGRFVVPAFATVIFNSVIIIGLWAGGSALAFLATSIALAAFVRLSAHIIAYLRLQTQSAGYAPRQLDKPLLRTYATAMSTGLLGLLPTYVPYALIAASGAGVAVFNYALKLVLMPALLAQTIAQMAVLPWLVAARKDRDATSLATLHAQTLQLAALAASVGALSLILCAPSLATLCFGYGQMTPPDIQQIAQNFTVGVLAMPAMLVVTLLQSMLYASGNARAAFVASLWQAAAILPLSITSQALWHSQGIMASFVLIQTLPIMFLFIACRHRSLLPPLASFGAGLHAACASLVVFVPLSLWASQQQFSPVTTIACAIFMGIVSLSAGLITYKRYELKHYV